MKLHLVNINQVCVSVLRRTSLLTDDTSATALFNHLGSAVLQAEELAAGVNLHHQVEILNGQIEDSAHTDDTGVCDELADQ